MDIDIDFPTTFDPLTYFDQAIRASMVKNNELIKHPVGVYFQKIAKDTITGFAAIPYKEAESVGYFKIDFLHLSILDHFDNKSEIRQLIRHEPDWNLLQDEETVSKLFQMHNHFNVLTQIKPQNVQELADSIALIRPGKRRLIPAYLKDKKAIREEIYRKPTKEDEYSFKKGHAISYALTIVLQLHLIKGGII